MIRRVVLGASPITAGLGIATAATRSFWNLSGAVKADNAFDQAQFSDTCSTDWSVATTDSSSAISYSRGHTSAVGTEVPLSWG